MQDSASGSPVLAVSPDRTRLPPAAQGVAGSHHGQGHAANAAAQALTAAAQAAESAESAATAWEAADAADAARSHAERRALTDRLTAVPAQPRPRNRTTVTAEKDKQDREDHHRPAL